MLENSLRRRQRGGRPQLMTIPAKYENGVFRPLADVHIKEGTVGKRRSIKDLPFYSMWKDRTDIGDGVAHVDKLRDNPRG
jgi:hypothetical protein